MYYLYVMQYLIQHSSAVIYHNSNMVLTNNCYTLITFTDLNCVYKLTCVHL